MVPPKRESADATRKRPDSLADGRRRAEALLELLVALNRFAAYFECPLIEMGVAERGLETHKQLGFDGSGATDESTGYATAQLGCAMRRAQKACSRR